MTLVTVVVGTCCDLWPQPLTFTSPVGIVGVTGCIPPWPSTRPTV